MEERDTDHGCAPRGRHHDATGVDVETLGLKTDYHRAIMTSADSAKLARVGQDLVQWILDQALDGIGPLPSASGLADDYKRQSYANDAARVQALIRWAVAKNTATGFVTGLGSLWQKSRI